MQSADFARLKGHIVRPDFDKHLMPLLYYRGNLSLGRMSRMWNFVVTCMESNVTSAAEAAKLSHNPDYAHLCGTIKPMKIGQLPGLFGRLIDNTNVTNNISGLTEYVRDFKGWKFVPTPVGLYTNDPYHKDRGAWWRVRDFSPEVLAERAAKKARRKAATEERTKGRNARRMLNRKTAERLSYPYMLHRPQDGDGERALLIEVHDAVPKQLPDWLRADICQDLLVAILAGEIDRSELQGSVKIYARKVLQMHPLKYGPLSLDENIPGTDIPFINVLTEEGVRARLGW